MRILETILRGSWQPCSAVGCGAVAAVSLSVGVAERFPSSTGLTGHRYGSVVVWACAPHAAAARRIIKAAGL